MSKLYLSAFLLFFLFGCAVKDKIIEQQGETLILAAMTTGEWKVTAFSRDTVDVTTQFSSYTFRFKTNYTVDAVNNGTVERSGTWNATGDVQSQTVTTNFPGAPLPLSLMNGAWNIRHTTWTSVDALQVAGTEQRLMHLDKQ